MIADTLTDRIVGYLTRYPGGGSARSVATETGDDPRRVAIILSKLRQRGRVNAHDAIGILPGGRHRAVYRLAENER